jgi:hypothetical protein
LKGKPKIIKIVVSIKDVVENRSRWSRFDYSRYTIQERTYKYTVADEMPKDKIVSEREFLLGKIKTCFR